MQERATSSGTWLANGMGPMFRKGSWRDEMDEPDLTVENGEWTAPLNRVAIILDERGEFSGVVADSPIDFYVVQPSCKRDRVYRYSACQYGPRFVQEAFDGNPVGHYADGTLDVGIEAQGKLPPSRPPLTIVK